ncbi:uncharacterized protein TM35_000761150, partial [Trypanosoma theileri]
MHRIHRDTLRVSQKLTALRRERDELETMKEWWRAKAEEEIEEEDDDDEFSQNSDVGWEEKDKWRYILQNALEEEESVARQSLYAMELAARREDCEWEWCVQ